MKKRFDIVGYDTPNIDLALVMEHFPEMNSGTKVEEVSWQGGGKVASGLVTAGRLGATSAIIGTVGDDNYGKFCRDDFVRHNVNVDQLLMRKDKTTSLDVILSELKNTTRSFVYHVGTAEPIACNEVPVSLLGDCEYFYYSQFTPLTKYMSQLARSKGAKIFVDADNPRGDIRARIPDIDVFIGSEYVYKDFFNTGSVEENCRRIMEQGPQIVVFTFGDKGCAGIGPDGYFEVPAYRVAVVDTVGAGDDFHGAYLVGLVNNCSAEKAARWASAVSAIKCTRIGGRAGIPDLETLQKFLKTGVIDYEEIDKRVKFYQNPFA